MRQRLALALACLLSGCQLLFDADGVAPPPTCEGCGPDGGAAGDPDGGPCPGCMPDAGTGFDCSTCPSDTTCDPQRRECLPRCVASACGANEVCEDGTCKCKPAYLRCGSDTTCVPANPGCADVCSTCKAPPYARPTCEGGVCGFECQPLYFRCGDGCCTGAGLALGGHHSCAITPERKVRCWGANDKGQLGSSGSASQQSTPTEVSGLSAPALELSAGARHTCALVQGGELRCWGDNAKGQLGTGTAGGNTDYPEQVAGLTSGVSAFCAGLWHSCAVVSGELRCWGDNGAGQLGDGTSTTPRNEPTPTRSLGAAAKAVGCGGAEGSNRNGHTCALTVLGEVWCFGDNSFGQLGNGTVDQLATPFPSPAKVKGLEEGIAAISAGGLHTCALGPTGAVYCWGSNGSGQIGRGSVGGSEPSPVKVIGSGALAVVAGRTHTCALMTGGSLRCWGRNSTGQLGTGDFQDASAPAATALTSGVASFDLGDGDNLGGHTCARMAAGGLKCWGSNYFGQLGIAESSPRARPADVPWPTGGTDEP